MKSTLLLAMAGLCLFAADPPKKPAAEPPKISDAQKKDAWKASSRYNAAIAAKNKIVAEIGTKLLTDLAAATTEEEKAKAALDATLGALCGGGFVVQPDATGDPQCVVKPIDPNSGKK